MDQLADMEPLVARRRRIRRPKPKAAAAPRMGMGAGTGAASEPVKLNDEIVAVLAANDGLVDVRRNKNESPATTLNDTLSADTIKLSMTERSGIVGGVGPT